MIEDNEISEEKMKLKQNIEGISIHLFAFAQEPASVHSMWFHEHHVLHARHSLLLCFSSETMEKLLKREKEVSTLTSQVEALKSQMGGKCRFPEQVDDRYQTLFLEGFLSLNLWYLWRDHACSHTVTVFIRASTFM